MASNETIKTFLGSVDFINICKGFVNPAGDQYVDVYAKVLKNHKAIIFREDSNGMLEEDVMFEITFNGETNDFYIDEYHKFDNIVIHQGADDIYHPESIVAEYVNDHLDKTDNIQITEKDVYTPWITFSETYLSTTLPDGMYYVISIGEVKMDDVSINLTAYKKFKNKCINLSEVQNNG